jgi:hypothetical protein
MAQAGAFQRPATPGNNGGDVLTDIGSISDRMRAGPSVSRPLNPRARRKAAIMVSSG